MHVSSTYPGTSDSERQLFGLIETVDRQQAAVQTALQGLAAERIALQQEREQFAQDRRRLEFGVQGAVQLAIEKGLGLATRNDNRFGAQ